MSPWKSHMLNDKLSFALVGTGACDGLTVEMGVPLCATAESTNGKSAANTTATTNTAAAARAAAIFFDTFFLLSS